MAWELAVRVPHRGGGARELWDRVRPVEFVSREPLSLFPLPPNHPLPSPVLGRTKPQHESPPPPKGNRYRIVATSACVLTRSWLLTSSHMRPALLSSRHPANPVPSLFFSAAAAAVAAAAAPPIKPASLPPQAPDMLTARTRPSCVHAYFVALQIHSAFLQPDSSYPSVCAQCQYLSFPQITVKFPRREEGYDPLLGGGEEGEEGDMQQTPTADDERGARGQEAV